MPSPMPPKPASVSCAKSLKFQLAVPALGGAEGRDTGLAAVFRAGRFADFLAASLAGLRADFFAVLLADLRADFLRDLLAIPVSVLVRLDESRGSGAAARSRLRSRPQCISRFVS